MALWIGVWSLMKKNDLLRSGDSIVRVLEIQGSRILIIDCIKQTMPVWMESESLESYSECIEDELSKVTGDRKSTRLNSSHNP